MMVPGSPLLLAALMVQSQAADSLRLLALELSGSPLVTQVRVRSYAVHDAVAQSLARSVSSSASGHDELIAAQRLAASFATAWRDSFLVREVARFAGSSTARRAAKVAVDSARRAGMVAFARDGPAAAITIWRRSLSRAVAIDDSADAAAILANLGAGFLQTGKPDSAEAYLLRARDLARKVGDVRVEGNALGALAGVSADRGDPATAREQYLTALALRERIGDTRGAAADHNNLGLLAQDAGDLAEARRQFEAALWLNRRDGREEIAATNLVNLAGLASLDGDFARAEQLYRSALATWRAQGRWADVADALRGLGQLEMRRGDYPAAADVLTEAVTLYDRTGPLEEAIAARQELAGAIGAAGDLQGAQDQLHRAQRQADSAQVSPGVRAGVALARADLAVELNAAAEPERLYAQALNLFRQAGDLGGQAEAQEGRGYLLLIHNEPARAQPLLENALRTQLAAGDLRSAARTRVALGQALRDKGDTASARRELSRAVAGFQRVSDPVGAADAMGELATLEARANLPAAAESLYRAGLMSLEGRVAPEVSGRLRAGLALARRAQGATDEAARELRSALAELEVPGRSLALPERRSGFLADKWDLYAQLALTERSRGRTGAAFEASERLRAREMLELLNRGRVTAGSGSARELVGREQDLRRRIGELMVGLEGNGATTQETLRGADPSREAPVTREALDRTQQAYAELLLEMREQAPRHTALVSTNTAAWQDVAQSLAPDQALIEYLVSDSGSMAFVVRRDSIASVDLGIGRRDLARLVDFARGALVPQSGSATDSLWLAPLRRLYGSLIDPLEQAGLLNRVNRLVIVPHAELHYLPFAALVAADGQARGRFLVERYELTITPSASVWLALGKRRLRKASGGLLALAPKASALPGSREEVSAIGRLVGGDALVLSDAEASEAAFRREAPAHRILHLATYGVLNKPNPLFSYVELLPGEGQDGRLEVHEVFGLDLAADLVVLSACQTGLGSGSLADVPPGDDWVGLTRAFLEAGAGQVVATLWPVEDRATAALMERFYSAFESRGDPSRALAAAQRALLATPATAHPFYWAGFVTVGGRRAQ